MKRCATCDHRFLDGAHPAAMAKIVKVWIEDPFGHFDPLPG
jgi:pyruvate/2-oxoglutarate dehydrogenase complex dihydrolipoamide acyltransferase (E2) component